MTKYSDQIMMKLLLFLISLMSSRSLEYGLPKSKLTLNKDHLSLALKNPQSSLPDVQRYPEFSNINSSKESVVISVIRGGATQKVQLPERKRRFSFAIKRNEVPCFIYMSVMMFLFIYVYTTVRDTKDTLLVSNCGAESIPFLKMYGVMPSAFLFIIFYSKLSLVCDKHVLFYATLLPFFAFYAIFAFFLYPNKESLHLALNGSFAGTLGPVANLIRFWTFSLYFIFSELWASAGVPLLFWQVANDITSVSQAKRFYPLFAVTGNLAPIASGHIMSMLVHKQKLQGLDFGSTLKRIAMIKLGAGFIISILYKLIYKEARAKFMPPASELIANPNKSLHNEEEKGKAIRSKEKMAKIKSVRSNPSLKESVIILAQSKELKSIAFMVLGYNICIELTEVLWKGLLRKVHTSESSYMEYMSSFSQKVGCIALALQLIAPTVISKLGWTAASQLTPLTMLGLALPFFFTVMVSRKRPESMPITLALQIGTWQNIVNKVAKYSMFDPLKEMAYIPLGPDAKTKGKASIDVLGARLGRSTAACLQQILVMMTGGILECAAFLGAFYVGIVVLWISSINDLGKMFNQVEKVNHKKGGNNQRRLSKFLTKR